MTQANTKPQPLKAPFPYFGGKARVSDMVWSRLGDVKNYIEPFCGSAAMLLRRPHGPRVETLNDVDVYITNFWRAIKWDKEAVADHCDWPVHEADLHARHRYLVLSDDAAAWRERMTRDPDYYDARIAGWWAWGLCMWIGGGWCSANPAIASPDVKGRPALSQTNGLHNEPPNPRSGPITNKRPQLCNGNTTHGPGVLRKPGASAEWEQRPAISDGQARGVHASGMKIGTVPGGRPQLADAYARGRGVHGNDARETCAERREWLLQWFGQLEDRLRVVRVCCGHWLRVCESPSVTTRIGTTGIFLDPPYAKNLERMHAWVKHLREPAPGSARHPHPDEDMGLFGGSGHKQQRKGEANRAAALYSSDNSGDVDKLVAQVHLYCLDRGANPKIRIALCGYAGEHDALEDHGWSVVAWKAQGGYANRNKKGNDNKHRERIWFSPHCLPGDTAAKTSGGAA